MFQDTSGPVEKRPAHITVALEMQTAYTGTVGEQRIRGVNTDVSSETSPSKIRSWSREAGNLALGETA